jgi:hypothetical protein
MNKLTVSLATLIVVLSGCGTQSASTSSSTTSALPPTSAPVGTPPASSAAPTPTSTSTGTSTGTSAVPTAGAKATLSYVGPVGGKRLRVTKTVTGATYQRLAEDLNALKPLAGAVECMVATGEVASITLSAGGHTLVFTVEGAPCRGVTVTKDGVAQPLLANSMTLVNQVRAIAGYSGMAHPLTG